MKATLLLVFALYWTNIIQAQQSIEQPEGYTNLTKLFEQWRAFETPPQFEGAPDYREQTFAQRRPKFEDLRATLQAIDTAGWPVAQKADYLIVWAEMNGYDFNQRVLQPWKRDPAFYKTIWSYRSDVPAHEGQHITPL